MSTPADGGGEESSCRYSPEELEAHREVGQKLLEDHLSRIELLTNFAGHVAAAALGDEVPTIPLVSRVARPFPFTRKQLTPLIKGWVADSDSTHFFGGPARPAYDIIRDTMLSADGRMCRTTALIAVGDEHVPGIELALPLGQAQVQADKMFNAIGDLDRPLQGEKYDQMVAALTNFVREHDLFLDEMYE